MVIRKIEKQDTGDWECRASNYLGSISHSFNVQVQHVSVNICQTNNRKQIVKIEKKIELSKFDR